MAGQTKGEQVSRSAGFLAPIGNFGIGRAHSRTRSTSQTSEHPSSLVAAVPASTTHRTTTIKENAK